MPALHEKSTTSSIEQAAHELQADSQSVSDNQMNEVRLSMKASELKQVTATLFSHLIFRTFSVCSLHTVGAV